MTRIPETSSVFPRYKGDDSLGRSDSQINRVIRIRRTSQLQSVGHVTTVPRDPVGLLACPGNF